MKPAQLFAISITALMVIAPAAAASTDASIDTATSTPPTEASTPPSTSTAPPTTPLEQPTTQVAPSTTTAPPATDTTTTTTTTVPVTTDLPAAPTTVTEGTGVAALDSIPEDVMLDTPATCLDAACVPTHAGGAVPVVRHGATLPFTGIEDIVAPILLALVVAIGGVVAIRWAQLRESVARAATRRAILGAGADTRTGYANAIRTAQIHARARRFYEPCVA